MLKSYKVEREIGGKIMSLEAGKIAKQAAGAVIVRLGDTTTLGTVVSADPRPGLDFFPLTVDYREKTAAAGKFPGGFMKREGRPSNGEILTMRMIDRPARPAFPKGMRNEVVIQGIVLSYDKANDPDILTMNASFAAITISDIPFNGPLAAVRVGRINGEFIINPTCQEMADSDMELVLGGHLDDVNMIEFEGQQLSNEDVLEAIKFGHKAIITICEMINELRDLCGKEKWAYEVPDTAELVGIMNDKLKSDYQDARKIEGKQDRSDALRTLFRTLKDELMPADEKEPKYSSQLWSMAKEDFEESIIRQEILDGNRAAGRGYDEVRTIECEVDVIPLVHGSALFTRGETQTLSTITLGTLRDEQIVDGIRDEVRHKFMLHYNFPPFCVGEARRIMGPGRREIGHGALAERSLIPVLPDSDKFPYTIRLNSDVMESNGSSSMATICGGTLSMMAAGVPLKAPVAGISVGAVSDDSKTILITDILGEEDHYGDMDFKVAGTREGITGIQLDLKNRGISYDMIAETLVAAEKARNGILDTMLDTISDAREETAESAPRITSIKIPQDMIGKIIGPGGKEIKRLQEDTGTNVEIEEDGTVLISCIGGDGHERAKNIIRSMVEPIKIGATYGGKVTTVKDFGAFIEIAPGKDGLCHVSELSHGYISNVTDVCKEGDLIDVKVIDVDEQGRIKLSIKALTEKPAKEDAAK